MTRPTRRHKPLIWSVLGFGWVALGVWRVAVQEETFDLALGLITVAIGLTYAGLWLRTQR